MELPRPIKILLLIFGLFFFIFGLVTFVMKTFRFIKNKFTKKKSVHDISIKDYDEVLNEYSGEKALYWISEDEAEWGGVKISFKGKVTSADLQKFIVAVMKEYDMDSVHLTAKQIVDVFIEDGIFVQGAQESKQNEA